jgi:hypothetical protein
MTDGTWRKSSYSGESNACVEVTTSLDEIRDSKDPSGPTLRVGRRGVSALIQAIKDGQLAG